LSLSGLRRRDVRHLWHPYTEITAFERSDFPVVERAHGCTLVDVEGREWLDGISSWWCANLGHGQPRIVEAIRAQAPVLQHTLLGGMSHLRAIELAERLSEVVPGGLSHAMFAADGSLAVEAALKIALQYRANRGETGRTRFIALEDGYHGDTLGTIGVGYVDAFHAPFAANVCPALRAPSPHCNRCPVGRRPETCDVECFEAMDRLIRERGAECTAAIVEPLCQAAGGMRIYPGEYLRRLRRACDEAGLLLIADEIATGFGRTGAMFACGLAGIVPDIVTLGKGLTGGALPMSATLCTDAVYDAFRVDAAGRPRTFFHGTTFCGNPITSAAALAALDLYRDERVVERLPGPAAQLEAGMQRVAEALGGSPLRTMGMIAAIEIGEAEGGAARARRTTGRAGELGLFVRPLGSTIYLWPPLTATADELDRMLAILLRAARDSRTG
jgi:adenosylmethionine-8-amino-7-oxononanoate aminotransferase